MREKDKKKLVEDIFRLKKEKNAVILAHNYQRPEVQDIADFVGDSLELARKATQADAKIIVFAGVDFMAQTAKILNPDKKVLIPSLEATCPMAHMLKPEHILGAKAKHPNAPVVIYVNSLIEAKALADVVVTSANAHIIVSKLDADEVIFGPDANLGRFVAVKTGKRVIPVPPDGYCYVHKIFTLEDISSARERFPDAKVMVHPECDPELQDAADIVASTGGMLKCAPSHSRWVVFTEREMTYRLKRTYTDREFIPAREDAVCSGMKAITLESVYLSLLEEKYEVIVPEDLAEKAERAIRRMFEL